MLRATIERKMNEQEILLKDLYASKAQIELERGMKITKEKILAFVGLLLQGDPNDKAYQKKIIDNLAYKVFVYDDTFVVYLNLQSGNEVQTISLADTDKAIEGLSSVQTQSSLGLHTIKSFFEFRPLILRCAFPPCLSNLNLRNLIVFRLILRRIFDYANLLQNKGCP